MKIFVMITLLLSHAYVHSFASHILCIDGGGTKTALQVIDAYGTILPLTKGTITTNTIETSGSNINTIGSDGVRQCLCDLFDDVRIENGIYLRDILATCYVVAGMAGTGTLDNKNAVINLFEELGIGKDHLLVTTDAALALQLIDGDGAILIAGTGSICLGKKNGKHYRVGGLGYLLGDEGSGYAIGLAALRAALADEYGWGTPTQLTSQLCKLYGVPVLKSFMQALYKNKVTPAGISRAAPLVVAQAITQDPQAVAIINNAATQLCDLVTTMATVADLYNCSVHLWGGLFKSDAAKIFITAIQQHPIIQQRRIMLVNHAWQNATTLFAQQNLCAAYQSQSDIATLFSHLPFLAI